MIGGPTTVRPIPARDFPADRRRVSGGRLPLDLLVAERIGLDGLEDAFAAMRRREGARRVIVY